MGSWEPPDIFCGKLSCVSETNDVPIGLEGSFKKKANGRRQQKEQGAITLNGKVLSVSDKVLF